MIAADFRLTDLFAIAGVDLFAQDHDLGLVVSPVGRSIKELLEAGLETAVEMVEVAEMTRLETAAGRVSRGVRKLT